MKLILDMLDVQRDNADGEIVVVKPGLFGGISTNQFRNHDVEFQDAIDTIGFKHIRWPGGTISEEGSVGSNGQIFTQNKPGMPFAYGVEYDDFVHPAALESSDGVDTGVMGLRGALEMAFRNNASFSFVLPTERYGADVVKAKADALAALERVFIQYVAEGVNMPNDIIVDIGNENFDTGQYAAVSLAILEAVKEFRVEHPEIEFKVALQSMFSGQKNIEFIEAIDGIVADKSIFVEIDIIRIHDLRQTYEDSLTMESMGAKYWALKGIVNYLENEVAELDLSEDFNLETYYSAWSVLSESPESSQIHGIRAAGTVLSQISGMLAQGVDYAAIWGVAAHSPSETSISSFIGGNQVYSPAAAALRLMSDSIIGTKMIDTAYDSNVGPVNIFAYKDDSKAVIFAAANDISNQGEWVKIDLRGLGVLGYAWGVSLVSDGAARAVISQANVKMEGTVVSFRMTEDYQVVRVIISRENPGLSPLELLGTFGDDRLKGGLGNDKFEGQEGNDLLIGGGGSDMLDGGDGRDTASWLAFSGELFVNLEDGQASYLGQNSLIRNIENVYGNNFSNWIIGDQGENLLMGLRGADTIDGRSSNDSIFGGRGDDQLFGSDGDDRLIGGRGRDSLFAGYGDDVLRGGRWSDVLYGGEGNDILMGGEGRDQLIGGLGQDAFVFRKGGDSDMILDFVGEEGDFIKVLGLSEGEISHFLADIEGNCVQTDGGVVIKFSETFTVYLDGIEASSLLDSYFVWG